MEASTQPEFVGVEYVAAELNLTTREAWEYIRKIGVPTTDGRMRRARFKRADYVEARDRNLKPVPTRNARPIVVAAPAKPAPRLTASEAARAQAEADAEQLARFKRRGRSG